ncbi:MAG: DUF1566 domain-containing protein [Acidobacteria bacterium]|nr:DUF1566 domain-containing protein [Acidobacteriota bacterium]
MEAESTWDRVINNPGRFKVLDDFNNEAVLDRETGLVWERTPVRGLRQVWFRAVTHCYFKSVGSRKGWRLPTIEELSSLVDPMQSDPALPPGHPFDNVQTHTNYWSATTHPADTSLAWSRSFLNGDLVGLDKSITALTWCVRGGHGVDAHQ